jgi:hypothetical protein
LIVRNFRFPQCPADRFTVGCGKILHSVFSSR